MGELVADAGAGDRIASAQRQSSRLSRQIAQSALHVLPGVGHMIHHSNPREVMAAIGASNGSMSTVNPRANGSELAGATPIHETSQPAIEPARP